MAGKVAAIGAGAGAAMGDGTGVIVGTAIFPGVGTLISLIVGATAGGAAVGSVTMAGVGAGIGAQECPTKISLENIILNKDLKVINDDSNNTIFNEIKRLNSNLDISNLAIIDKKTHQLK